MARKKLSTVEPPTDTGEPLERRIATGLHKIGLALKHQTWRQASHDGLSPTQGQILAALAVDGELTLSELKERLGLTLPTLSESARVLVDKALIEKRPDPRHPRASLLSLTKEGSARATSARAWPELLAGGVSTLSEEEQRVFLVGLVKLIRTLQREGQIPLNRMCVTCVHFRPRVHDGDAPHHCAFIDAPLADHELRLDCRDHEEAPAPDREAIWERFLRAG